MNLLHNKSRLPVPSCSLQVGKPGVHVLDLVLTGLLLDFNVDEVCSVLLLGPGWWSLPS